MSDYKLGKKILPPAPPPAPEWRPYKKNMQINRSGQIRTVDPKNEVANPPYGWPNYRPAIPLEPDLPDLGDDEAIV
jgi:hypothetical protein